MAGHSKWANIRHRKGAQDKKRGKIFTKIAKEITIAAGLGGDDPSANPRLRLALTKARSANMPKDNIARAVKKGTGEGNTATYTEKVYEGYGPAGVAVIVECLTDNVNRTVSEVRHAFGKFGGNLGTEGSVSWMFQKKGILVYDRKNIPSIDTFFEKTLESGAEDIEEGDGLVEVSCDWQKFSDIKDAIESQGIEPELAEVQQVPENYNRLNKEQTESLNKIIDWLEDLDDVQTVSHNGEVYSEES